MKIIHITKDRFIHKWLKIPYELHSIEFISCQKPAATVVLLHGLGNTFDSWKPVIELLPNNIRVIGIDLLGFGDSPKPNWATYKISTQTKSVSRTLLGMKLKQKPILVGHSMGALIAINLASKWPLLLKHMILCSPPVYEKNRRWFSHQGMLINFYKYIEKHPENLSKIAPKFVNRGLANESFNVKGERLNTYLNALENSIIKQDALEQLQNIKVSTEILYGLFDPLVIGKNLRIAASKNSKISMEILPVAHEVVGKYAEITAKKIVSLCNK